MEVSVRILEDAISAKALDRRGEMAWGKRGETEMTSRERQMVTVLETAM